MTLFVTLTFHFGIVKKDLLCHYWSVDSVMSTPFPRSIMSRQEFFNVMSFLHCCYSSDYPGKGQPGYNPRNKIGKVFMTLKERFQAVWTPRCHILIDEGTIPFKGNIQFKVFNPMKPDKYGIETYTVCDSTNSYCLVFDMYVGQTDVAPPVSKYDKTHDLVISLLQRYTEKGYIVYMDNYYSSSYLFYNLLSKNTAACGPICIPRKGLPEDICTAKFKKQGKYCIMTYSDKLVAIKLLYWKHVTLFTTAFNFALIDTGKKHWKTNEPIKKHDLVHQCNCYMRGVDCNDQLLKYSAFNRRTLKWWKKVLFCLLDVTMVNVYVLHCEWSKK